MCAQETPKKKRCGKYSFRLVGKQKDYFKGATLVDFKPLQKTKKIEKIPSFPTYNNDSKFYTPAFIIPSLPLENDDLLREQHEKRLRQNTQQISQILVPKPRSRQKYCGVCREYYEEYLTHVETDKHLGKLRNSLFQGYIIQQSLKFRQINQGVQTQFHKNNCLQISCQTIPPSTEEDLIAACLNFA